MTRQLLRITTAGSVDDGKSTLIGRLLHDTDSLPTDHLEAVTDEEGVADLAALSDGLRAEREQGITIDVAYRFFSTETRSYILADTPGHERYTRNMFTGASNAHVAVLLVDARAGVLRQTRRHARIAKLLGIKHFVATVNKFDLVDFDRGRFAEVEAELRQVAARLGGSRRHGDPDRRQTRRQRGAPLRPHAVVRRPDPARVSGGVELSAPQPEARQAAAAGAVGVAAVRRAAPPLHRPALRRARCRSAIRSSAFPQAPDRLSTAVDTLDDDRATAVAPLSVSIELADDIDVGRGDVFVSGADDAALPVPARELDATVCWFADTRCGPATGSRSSRAPAPCGPPCRRCTPGSIRRRSTTSTTQSSWRSTTSAR